MIFEYEGRDIAALVSMTRCVYESREEGRVSRLIAEFEDQRGIWDSWNPQPGDCVAVSAKGAAATGKLYVRECRPTAIGYELRADALPRPDVEAIRTWRETTLCSVVSQLAAVLGLGVLFHGVSDMALSYVKQDGEGALPVLARLCSIAGCIFDVYGGVLHVCGRDWVESQASVGTVEIAGDSDYSFRRRQAFTRCSVEQTAISGVRPALAATYGVAGYEFATVLDSRMGVPGTAELERACAGILACVNARQSFGNASSDSLSALSPGSVCDLSCPRSPSISGRAVITRVRNDYVNNRSKIWWR